MIAWIVIDWEKKGKFVQLFRWCSSSGGDVKKQRKNDRKMAKNQRPKIKPKLKGIQSFLDSFNE